jgi:hypothetical protein
MFDQQERRQYPRATIKLPVVMAAENLLVDGTIQDLGLGGAFVHCLEMPIPRDNFRMIITAEGRLISVSAEVVWTGTHRLNNKTLVAGMGVRFRQILNADRMILGNVIARRYRKRISRMAARK